MKKYLIMALVLGLPMAVGGWLLLRPHHPRQENMEKFETDITAGLLQGIIQETDADKPRYYYVAFGEERTDPSRLFIARFASHFPPVRGISSAAMLRDGQWQETSSARIGVIIQIIRVKKNRDDTFEALVRFPKQPAGQNRLRYRLVQNHGQWRVQYHVPDN